jgi:hypothetical protein
VRYTLDGTTPNSNSRVYTSPIVINEDTVIKAISIRTNYLSSKMVTFEYRVSDYQKPDNELMPAPVATANGFGDLSGFGWAETEIRDLAKRGIIKGKSETVFAPSENITRADYMILLVRMLGLNAAFDGNFYDVQREKYYYNEIGVARALELTTGVGDNYFAPEEYITRQDMFTLAYRIMLMQKTSMQPSDERAIINFNDYSEISDYARYGMASLSQNGLINGFDGLINPTGYATRAETAVFIYRLSNFMK